MVRLRYADCEENTLMFYTKSRRKSFINSSSLIEFQPKQPATNQHVPTPGNNIIMFGMRKSNSQSIILASMELIMVALKQ